MPSSNAQWELTRTISISVASLDWVSGFSIQMKKALEWKSFVCHYEKYNLELI